MNEQIDPRFAAWLADGAERGSRDGLLRTLEVTRRTPQRGAWRYPSRWLPVSFGAWGSGAPRAIAYVLLVAILLIALLTAALVVGSRPHLPAPFGLAGNGLIAYASRGEIYVAEPDGSGARLLPSEAGRRFGPAFSPTGDRLAYWSQPVSGGPVSLIVAKADGSDPRTVIADPDITRDGTQTAPSWAPDGSALAFSTANGDRSELVIVRLDSREFRTVPLESGAIDTVSWSPSGQVIAFRRTADPVVSLVIVAADGSDERELVSETIADSPPGDPGAHAYNLRRAMQGFAWSPDGSEIAYSSSSADIKAVDVTGRVRLLAADPDVAEFNPVWSPTGTRLAFFGDNGESIVVAGRDGGSARIYAATSLAKPCLLFWSPDERSLLGSQGARCPEAAGRLVALDLETGQGTPLGVEISADGLPSWQRVVP
jgi:Tol biopolymer transport system component